MAELALTTAIVCMVLFDRFIISDEKLSVKLFIARDPNPLYTLLKSIQNVRYCLFALTFDNKSTGAYLAGAWLVYVVLDPGWWHSLHDSFR